jgi:hypothetical protein
VTNQTISVETCDRNDLNNAGKICKIKLSDKGTSSSGEGAMFGDSLPPQMLLENNGNFLYGVDCKERTFCNGINIIGCRDWRRIRWGKMSAMRKQRFTRKK